MNRTGIFHLKLCRQKRCKSRSRIRGQTCQLSQPATRPDLGFKTVIIDSLDPSPHLETQEHYAKLVLSEQIFPTPKYEPNDKQTGLFWWGAGRKKTGQGGEGGGSSSCHCCLSHCLPLLLPCLSQCQHLCLMLDIGFRTCTEFSCTES